jgi:dihydroxyacetone kinase
VSAQDVADAVASGIAAMQATGKAGLGDKTMLDALIPFSTTLQQRITDGDNLASAWSAAADIAEAAAQATAHLSPRVGRARPLAERSVGTPDPGAISVALCLRAAASVLSKPTNALEA